MRAHPRSTDVALAVLVALPAMLVPTDAPSGIASATPAAIALVLAACGALVLRRVRPLAVWLVTLGAAIVAVAMQSGPSGALFPALVGLYTVAALRSTRVAIGAGFITAASLIAALGIFDDWQSPTTYIVLAWCGLAVAVGFAVRGQRRLVAAAEERAQQAEATHEEEAQRRVTEERLRIARELHDVVAHHIAVVNVQSGVALHLLDSDPAEARKALGHVRASSRDVLAEMSTLLGVLRTTEEDDAAPAPGLSDLDELVDSMRRTGLQVTLHEVGARAPLPPLVDLTAYRVVQEALTNAHKHGAGSADLTIEHADAGTVIEVTNPMAPGSGVGTGLGLVGMGERVQAVGGALAAEPDGRGTFRVRAELPSAQGAAS